MQYDFFLLFFPADFSFSVKILCHIIDLRYYVYNIGERFVCFVSEVVQLWDHDRECTYFQIKKKCKSMFLFSFYALHPQNVVCAVYGLSGISKHWPLLSLFLGQEYCLLRKINPAKKYSSYVSRLKFVNE